MILPSPINRSRNLQETAIDAILIGHKIEKKKKISSVANVKTIKSLTVIHFNIGAVFFLFNKKKVKRKKKWVFDSLITEAL